MTFPSPCPDSDLLRAIMRGSTDADEQQRIEEHLQTCAQCRAVMDLILDEGTESAGVGDPQMTEVEAKAPERPKRDLETVPSEEEDFTDFLRRICRPSATCLGQIGPYEIVARIGRGGMGAVVKARDTRLDRYVAIKFLRPEYTRDISFVDRFLREARTAAAINHPNVVTVHSVEEIGDTPYLVMEFVDGESLQSRMKRVGLLPVDQVARIGSQIAAGLGAAHDRKVVHRDIKPENILLVNGTDQVKITDFGLAQADGAIRLTRSGVLLGTPKYMSPEQARGETLDHRTDLFSLGSVLYVMAAGQPPFNKKRQSELIKDVAEANVPPIESINPALPKWLVATIHKLHKRRPVDRFQSARDVAKLLKQHAGRSPGVKISAVQVGSHDDEDDGDTVVQPVETSVASRSMQRRWILAAVGVAAAVTLVSIGVSKFPRSSSTADGATANVPNVVQPDAAKAPVEPAPAAKATPFVMMVDQKEKRFESLLAAYREAVPGQTITIEANGELEIPKLIIDKPLTLKAKEGFQPILVETLADHLTNDAPLLTIAADVVLEGLEFKSKSPTIKDVFDHGPHVDPEVTVRVDAGKLAVTYCRFRLLPGHPMQIAIRGQRMQQTEIIATEILGGCAFEWESPIEGRLVIQDSCNAGVEAIRFMGQPRQAPAAVEMLRSTFINAHVMNVELRRNGPEFNDGARPMRKINFRAEDCVFDARHEMFDIHGPGPAGAVPNNSSSEFALDRLINWAGGRNSYDLAAFATVGGPNGRKPIIADFAQWQQSWFGREASSETAQVLLVGDRPTFEPTMVYQTTANDLRMTVLTPDGKVVTGRGAPLDRIGPGTAYEKWSRSPEAKTWRTSHRAEPSGL